MQVHGSQQVVPGNLQKCKFSGPGPDLLGVGPTPRDFASPSGNLLFQGLC